jgi:hypothetical protein
MTTHRELFELMADATIYCDVLDRGAAAGMADWIINEVINAFRSNARFPRLSRLDWEVLLGDVRKAAEDQLTDLIDDHVEYRDMARSIAHALLDNEDVTITINGAQGGQ